MEVTVSFAINFYANKDTQDLPSPASSEFLISFWPSLCITQRKHFTQQWPLDPVGLWKRLRSTRDWAADWQLRCTIDPSVTFGEVNHHCRHLPCALQGTLPKNSLGSSPSKQSEDWIQEGDWRYRKIVRSCLQPYTAQNPPHCFHPALCWQVPCHCSTVTLFQNSCVWPGASQPHQTCSHGPLGFSF